MVNRGIKIHVLPKDTTDPGKGRAGTFLGPPPLVRVNVGDRITFKVTPAGSEFSVVFPGLSPFPAGTSITHRARTAVFTFGGRYHYHISVTVPPVPPAVVASTFRITSCPEIEG